MASVEDFIVDFSKQEESSGGAGVKVPDAWHLVKVISAKPTISAQKSTPGLEVTFAFMEGKLRKGKKKITDTLWNSPKAYSRFRLLLEACGKKVPAKVNASKIAAAIKGSELYIETETEAREGYEPRSRVAFRGFMNPDDFDPSAEDDVEEEDEELEEEDEDLEDEEDEDLEDEDEEDEDEDEEEEPAPPPRRKKAAAKKKAPAKKPAKKRKPAKDDDDDLDSLDLDSM